MSILKKDPNRIHEEKWNSTHFNSHHAVGVAIKTTGPDSKKHEIVQICIFPLTSRFELSRETIPLYCDIKPIKPQIDINLLKGYLSVDKYKNILNGSASSPQTVANLFDDWFEKKIRPAPGKKLMPLAYNWAWQKPFIRNWLGPINFEETFSSEYRDIMCCASFANDYADHHGLQLPYPKVKLSFLANIFRIDYHRNDDTILHVDVVTKIYKEMFRKILPSF